MYFQRIKYVSYTFLAYLPKFRIYVYIFNNLIFIILMKFQQFS